MSDRRVMDSWRRWTVLCVTSAAVGVSGALLLWLWARRHSYSARTAVQQAAAGVLQGKRIVVLNSRSQWPSVSEQLTSYCRVTPVLGLDCEWVQQGKKKQPVALLQLATLDGLCLLIQLNMFNLAHCHELQTLLSDRRVLKVGVSCLEDAALLAAHRGVCVRGCVDVRNLVLRHPEYRTLKKLGLAALALQTLNVKLDKHWKLSCSDWEAAQLSSKQQEYAATDALVGALLFSALLRYRCGGDLTADNWSSVTAACQGLVDIPFRQRGYIREDTSSLYAARKQKRPDGGPQKVQQRGYCTRKTRLYDNARLLAPDGQPLSIIDNTKARWYVDKGLADLMSDSPLTVQLRFEPAGRPQQEGSHGHYYLQEKANQCVICGANNGYVRKNIVPQEYRKHFPDIMKSHQSHDVLLLCLPCHQQSNLYDNALKSRLAVECRAPISQGTDIKMSEDSDLRRVKSAGGALLHHGDKIPEPRAAELREVLRQHYGTDTITTEMLQQAFNISTHKLNDQYMSHGELVYRHYSERGLVHLELRWRQHFLDGMRPRFLPRLWSVQHNHSKLRDKIQRSSSSLQDKRQLWKLCTGTEYTDQPTQVN